MIDWWKNFKLRFSVQHLHDNLDYWIFIGIGQDIVDMPIGRIEYQHLVKKAIGMNGSDVPMIVLILLKQELDKPWYMRPTFWYLVNLNIRRIVRWR